MFKKIFRPPSSAVTQGQKKDPKKISLSEKENESSTTQPSPLNEPPEGTVLLSDNKCSEQPKQAELPTIDPLNITIEDLDPYAKPNRMRRSKSFSFQPSSKPDPGFKLPRSKSVHFADQLGKPVKSKKPATPDDKSLVYTNSSGDAEKESPYQSIHNRLLGIFFKSESPEPKEPQLEKAVKCLSHNLLVSGDVSHEPELGDAYMDEKPVEALKCVEDGEEGDEWDDSDDIFEDKDEIPALEKLSTLYQKYFSSLQLEGDDLDNVISGIDFGINDTLQETKFCKALLSTAEKRADEAENDTKDWKEKFTESSNIYEKLKQEASQREAELEKKLKAAMLESSSSLSSLNEKLELCKSELKQKDKKIEEQNNLLQQITDEIKLLTKENQKAAVRCTNASYERDSLKQRINEIESSVTQDIKAKDKVISALKLEKQDFEKLLTAKVEEVKSISSISNDQEDKLQVLKQKIEEFETSKAEMESIICVKDAKILEQEERSDAIESSMIQLKKTNLSLNEDLVQFKKTIDDLRADNIKAMEKNEMLRSERDAILIKLESMQSKISEGTKELEDAEKKNAEALDQLKALYLRDQEQASEYTVKLEHQEAAKKELEELLAHKEALINKLQEEVNKRRLNFHKCFEAYQMISWSNKFAMDSLKRHLKESYEAMAPFFLPESASDYTGLYYQLVLLPSFNKDNQAVLTRLTTALVESNRQMVKRYIETYDNLNREKSISLGQHKELIEVIRSLKGQRRRQKEAAQMAPPKKPEAKVESSTAQPLRIKSLPVEKLKALTEAPS